MTDLRGLRLVAGREIRESLRRRTFWIVVAVLLVGSIALMVLPEVIGGDEDQYDVVVVGDTPSVTEALQAAAAGQDVELDLQSAATRAEAERAVEDEQADAGALVGPPAEVIVRGDGSDRLIALLQQGLATDALASELSAAGLDDAEVREVLTAPTPEVVRLEADSSGRQAAAVLMSIVLYLVLFTLMLQVANGTAIEKANRISEVLLAIVRPGALLFGKVLGVGTIGLLTLLVAALPVVVKLVVGGDLPEGTAAAVSVGAAWFLLGMALYLTLAGVLASLVERQEEAGSVVTPLIMILVGGYLVAQSAADSPLGTVLAYLPLTSSLIMPSRLALGVSSPAEMVLSLLIGLAALAAILRWGSVVYRRAIVRTGRRLRLREVLRPA